MSIPPNIFDQINYFRDYFDPEDLMEQRFENDGDGNPIYVGYSPVVDADPADPVWYIQQVVYDGTDIVRRRLPVNGVQFTYVWDDRASYF